QKCRGGTAGDGQSDSRPEHHRRPAAPFLRRPGSVILHADVPVRVAHGRWSSLDGRGVEYDIPRFTRASVHTLFARSIVRKARSHPMRTWIEIQHSLRGFSAMN